jgi:nitroreductase
VSEPADTVRPLLAARQTREFSGGPVDQDALDAIADAGRWSGSRENRQPWRFIVVHERSTLDALADAARPQAQALRSASAAIAVAMPVEPKTGISLAFDEGRAAERMLVAATMVGLAAGINWVGADERPAVGAVLGVPDDWFIRTIMAIGHPADTDQARPSAGRARLPREETVRSERWSD